MEILIFILGTWIGVMWAYFTNIKPLMNENKKLKEAMHDCIKSGL